MMDADQFEAETRWFNYLLGCLGEVINCTEDPELLEDELARGAELLGALVDSASDDERWTWKTVQAKQNSRGAARLAFATTVAHRLSRTGERDPAQKERLMAQVRERRLEWLDPRALVGTYLSQIEACWVVRRKRCRCTDSCEGVKFAREWAKVERAEG